MLPTDSRLAQTFLDHGKRALYEFSDDPSESRNATGEEATDALGNCCCLHSGMPP